jgi:hypothetical protein
LNGRKRYANAVVWALWRTNYISLLSVYLFYTDIRHQYHELFEGFAVQHNAGSGIMIDDTDSMMQTFFGPAMPGFTCTIYYRMHAEKEHFID